MSSKVLTLLFAAVLMAGATQSPAQTSTEATPAPKPTPPRDPAGIPSNEARPASPGAPDDTPSIKVGATIFSNFTYTEEPLGKDANGNAIHPESFEVTRAYVNVTGSVSHLVSFRVTPDITTRLSTAASTTTTTTTTLTGAPAGTTATSTSTSTTVASTSYDGSLVYRLKYAYGQLNLDDWTTKGSWVRLGQIGTPYTDLIEPVYRYRFQGNVFVEKEGYVSTSDVGLGAHYAIANDHGDVQAGIYNGEGYAKPELNDQKALQLRVTLRPLPQDSVLKGLRVTGFYDGDHYNAGNARNRLFGALTFEHPHVNAGAEYLSATDQATDKSPEVKASGFSLWATPRTKVGVEALLRFDHLKPNTDADASKSRTVAGISYWFKAQKEPNKAAILADYEHVSYDAQPPGSAPSPVAALGKPKETRYALHFLLNF